MLALTPRAARHVVALLASVLFSASSFAQATSQWLSASSIPLAVVEVPGGDLEHLVVVAPPEVSLPATVMGRAATVTTQPGATVWTLSVPELLTVVAAREVLGQLTAAGAVVAVGPVPARDLRSAFDLLDAVSYRPPPKRHCIVADGTLEVLRGADERVELAFAAPSPGESEFPLTEALAAWLRVRLSREFAGFRVDVETVQGCSRLRLQASAGDDEPRRMLERLRNALRSLAVRPASDTEVAEVQGRLQRRSAKWATTGSLVARELADGLAHGAPVSALVAPPTVTADVLAGIAAKVLATHSGAARVVEQERRAGQETQETLDNGVVVSWRWIPGEVAVAAVAFGGLEPGAGRSAARSVAAAAAASGWVVDVVDLLGLNLVAVAVPAADVAAVLETTAESLAALPAAPLPPLDATLADRLGLARAPTAESLSLAMALPIEADEAPEAATKFFASLPSGELRSAGAGAETALSWSAGALPPRLLAVVDLPADATGLLAGSVLAARLAGIGGVTPAWVAAPGRLLLRLDARGDGDVPSLDNRLAQAWAAARAPAADAEIQTAAATLAAHLSGDLARSTARAAATHFLPALPSPEALLVVEAEAISVVLRELPPWTDLTRAAEGPAPPQPTPAPDVRQSRPRRR